MDVLLDWSHALSDIPDGGLSCRRRASAEERAAIAAQLDLLSCGLLGAHYRLTPLSQGRFLLEGTLDAEVVQRCVVTLEPVANKLHEVFDVEFRPSPVPAVVDAMESRDIEPLDDGVIPAGRIVYEQFASALDPYPRKEGATLDRTATQPDEAAARPNPFALLERLKPRT